VTHILPDTAHHPGAFWGAMRSTYLSPHEDVLISTLRRHVKSMGGELKLVAKFPNHKPVILSGLADADDPPQRHPRRTA